MSATDFAMQEKDMPLQEVETAGQIENANTSRINVTAQDEKHIRRMVKEPAPPSET